MATKSSTKAKTKTSKPKTAKTAAASKKTTTATSPAKRPVTLPRLRSLHMLSAGVFVLLALAAGMFMSNQSSQLTLGLLTEDPLSGSLAPAIQVLFDVEARWLLVGTLVVSAALPLLYITRLEKRYQEQLTTSRFVPWRWVDFGVTGALMIGTIMLLSGVQDVIALKVVADIVFISFILGWISERINNSTDKPVWAPYGVAVFAAVIPWLALAASAISTVMYGAASAPWYVYALYATVAIGFLAIFKVQLIDLRRRKATWQRNYLIVERNYIAINLLMKTVFAVILIVGLLQ